MKHYIFYYDKTPFTQESFQGDAEAIAAAKSKPGLTSVLACDGSRVIYNAKETVKAIEPEPVAVAAEKAEEHAQP